MLLQKSTLSPPTNIIILGSGAVGLCTAYFLSSKLNVLLNKTNYKIHVFDPDLNSPDPRASSFRSAASCRVQFSTPENIQLSIQSSKFFQQPPFGDLATGSWKKARYIFTTSSLQGNEILRSNIQLQQSLHTNVQLLSPNELQQKLPWIDNLDGILNGSYGDDQYEGFIDAHLFFNSLKQACVKNGVLFEKKKVIGAKLNSNNITELTILDMKTNNKTNINHFSHVVCAMGAWSNQFAQYLGLDIPIRARRRVLYVMKPTISPSLQENILWIEPSGVWFRNESLPSSSGTTTTFIAGKSPDDDQDYNPDDTLNAFDTNTESDLKFFNEEIWPVLGNRISNFITLKHAPTSWAGWYDYNYFDYNLMIGFPNQIQNCIFASGASGHGLQHSPAVGNAISELCLFGHYQTIDLSRFDMNRKDKILERNVV
jgi:glycine/D-amino acid oxidase-like deaminating enzyme